MRPLDRLRRKVTVWYVATVSAILLVFSIGLFFAIRQSIGLKLDQSLVRAAREVQRTVMVSGAPRTPAVHLVQRVRDLRIPDRMLYLFDTHGRALYPDTASAFVNDAARTAARSGAMSLQADIGHEHTLRVHAVRFVAPNGDTLVAAAAADTEELEDEYANLITLFAGALIAALACVGLGGYVLARRASEPVEASIDQMRRFMADAAHELRTPVSYVRAHAEVALQQPREAGEYADVLREISSEADRLGAIVNDLFTLARAESGERRAQCVDVYLDDAVLEVASEARTVATIAGVHIDVTDFEESLINADPVLVRQLVRIVLDNAIKYTPAGGRVAIAVTSREGRARVVVDDSGIGISAEALPRIYDRFYRAETAREKADGAGLGLSIARWIADVHRAELVVTSPGECGTRVEITFQCGDRNAANQRRAATMAQTPSTAPNGHAP